ncbi:MAG: hypothetical protein Q9N32_02910 [Gammaproteobacteria bacterium]|nr:hypothetical protein [Gammaproteobacteria bacterium]
MKLVVAVCSFIVLIACSDEGNNVEEHIWKEQTDMIDKAKDVENLLDDAAIQQQKMIEQQIQ